MAASEVTDTWFQTWQQRKAAERERGIQVEEQRIAEQQRQHPPAPPLPVGASHWDRLPAELHGMIIEASGPLTKLAVGAVTPEQLEAASSEEQQQAWEDAFATDWQGNLGLLPDTPLGVESFMHINSRSMHARVKALEFDDFKQGLTHCAVLHEWRDLVDLDEDPDQLAEDAAVVGALWPLRELIDERRTVEPSEELASAAARSGQLSVIKFLHERSPDGSWSDNVATAAITCGHPDVAEWLLENRSEGCYSEMLCDVIRGEHPDSYVKMVVDRGWMVVTNHDLGFAVQSRSVDLMQFLRDRGGDRLFDASLIEEAAHNSVEMTQWLHREFGFVPTSLTLTNAVYSGKVDVVRWLLETFPDIDWDMREAFKIAKGYTITKECLPILKEWAAQHGQTFED
ncbi:hypothetical protein HK105_203442 [Polyrhizophydium stewartii]|uniref:Ankyrin repeat protein n=1 Tax=Polyrhizophydium stewartii TaxID=2732419 RepID=A0ABR4NBW8_9FUNG